MSQQVCCVCEEPIDGEIIIMGNRPYCSECRAKTLRNRRGLWLANVTQIVALLAFVAVVVFIVKLFRPQLSGLGLVLAGILLSVVPAVIWLAFFYAQDYREPEPKQLVIGVFVLGALLARAVGIPLINGLFRLSSWIEADTLTHILGSILVVGFAQQFLIYAAVRYSVYNSAEFDERVDGVIYATSAALGYATMVNLEYVLASGGVDLVSGIIRIAATAMAFASFGGITGYFMGRCKFEDEPLWWMPVGLVLASLLNGLFAFFRGEVTTTRIGLNGGGYNPWPGLILGTIVAGITFAILFFLIRRLQKRVHESVGA